MVAMSKADGAVIAASDAPQDIRMIMAQEKDRDAAGAASPSQRIAIVVLRAPITLYRWFVSPFLPATCRHVPSCSTYAQEAILRHGAWRGGWLTASRLARCNPLGSQGLDPVPDRLPGPYGFLSAWRYGRWTGRHITHRFHEGD